MEGGGGGGKREDYRWWYKDVLPFVAMVAVECSNVGLNTLYKAAVLQGMSFQVYLAYSYGIAALLLLPSPFFSHRSNVLPPFHFSITTKILLLGIIGFTATMAGHVGINYSSPTLSSTMSNLVPAFTFILALVFRMERFALSSSSSQAKLLGTIISIAGAFIVNLYKGSRIVFTPSTPSVSLVHLPLGSSPRSYWAIGGLLFTVEYTSLTIWYILMAQVMKKYPAELTMVFFYSLIVSILAAIVGVFTVTDSSAWRIRPNIALISILCSGIIGSIVNNVVRTWALRVKGPLFVALFKPLSIAIAVAMGVLFLGDIIYLGSVIGATVISVGFYTVMWGKAKEEIMGENNEVSNSVDSESSSSTPEEPLLQS